MKILQLHVDFIEYKPVKKEIAGAEEAKTEAVKREDLVVLLTAVEPGDDAELAGKAVMETKDFLGKLGTNKVLIYPFAHISQNLARPADALPVLKEMEKAAGEAGLDVSRAPFGWNKALQLKIKGHPLAEMSRSYAKGEARRSAAPPRQTRELSDTEAMSRLRRSDFGSLPETDHRTIGQREDIFSLQEVSPGMAYWHDRGVKLWNILLGFMRAELAKRGYVEVSTPALANTALWRVSGHSDHYRDNMFLTSLGEEEFGLKPMNCPQTFLIYKTRKWSFRDLPVRFSTFDSLYRNELSGVASGLLRVKILTQDDAHVVCTEEQAEEELKGLLDLMEKVYGVFGLGYRVKISTRPDESMGTDEEWERATQTLMRVVKAKGWSYDMNEKDGSFYAPKIDVDITDSLGRKWQCGTFQLDLQMPKRFKMTYTGADGKEHTPVVLHRTILGSMERFIGIMLEHYKGALPVWLSPVQVKVIPLSDEHRGYAQKVLETLVGDGLRAEGALESGTMGAKIRDAQLLKIPYMLVVGKKEEDAGTVAVRTRAGEQRFGVQLADFVSEVRAKAASFE